MFASPCEPRALPVAAVGPALARLGLEGRLASTPVGSLSAGQRRRVALAALVARDPELWLLDEPHAGLDAEHRDLLDELVRHVVGRGRTVLLASHEHDRAAALAGRIVTVAGGMITAPTASSFPECCAAMWRDAVLVGEKDLRVELRSRVTTMHVAPYAVLVLLLFGFAFDQNHTLLTAGRARPLLVGRAPVHPAGRAAQLRRRGG